MLKAAPGGCWRFLGAVAAGGMMLGLLPMSSVAALRSTTGTVPPPGGLAYSGAAAAAYADRWWNSRNPAYIYLSGDDCTNFVSQALNAGHWDYIGYFNKYDDSNWWYYGPTGAHTNTWTASANLWNYMSLGWQAQYVGKWGPAQAYNRYTPGLEVTGDVILYDWNSDGVMDHTAIQVGYGPTTDGHNGNYIDQHTNNRYHVFWSDASFNTRIDTTTYTFFHIFNG